MKFIILILFSILFSGVFSEIFILKLSLKSVDSYVSSMKYQFPLINDNTNSNNSVVGSSISLYNDEDNVASEMSLGPSKYRANENAAMDNETRNVLTNMYIEDYTFNSSDYMRVKGFA